MRTLKSYMFFDLLILTVIGCIIEFIVTKACGAALTAAPTTVISMLIVVVALARWNGWGVLVIPFLCLANMYGGRLMNISYLAAAYDWKLYLSSVIGLTALSYNLILFKKYTAKKLFNMNLSAIIFILTSYVVYCSIQFLSYRLICSGTLTHSGLNIFDYTNKDGVLKTVNLCTLGEGGFAFNLIGLIIFVVGILILRSQGVVCNVKNKLIDDKKNAELNRINTENFTVEEAGSDDESSEK